MSTGIEWTDRVWNPTTGCDRVSPGCDHCYALTMAKRLKGMGSAKYQRDGDSRTSGPGFGLTVHPGAVNLPLRWKKPAKVFVNSMSDLFHDKVPTTWLADIFGVMAATPWHTYQVLTKRHGRMRSLLNDQNWVRQAYDSARDAGLPPSDWRWPLPNVWMGVSAEDQPRAFLRINALRKTPAAVRWVSAEPMLGPTNLVAWLPSLDWVVAGGESGPGARPAHPDWFRSLRDQCTAAGVPFHFKQWGELVTEDQAPDDITLPGVAHRLLDEDGPAFFRVGKKAAGRLLDGVLHDAYPTIREETHRS